MKILYLVRHAKSSWDYPDLSDKERPLNKRGSKNAPVMAKHLKSHISCPDTFICSTSRRTQETAQYFLDSFNFDKTQMVHEDELYHAYSSDFERVISQIDNRCDSAMLFAHNPGITDYANQLIDRYIDNIPTSGVVGIDLDIDDWKQIKGASGEQLFYFFPKGI